MSGCHRKQALVLTCLLLATREANGSNPDAWFAGATSLPVPKETTAVAADFDGNGIVDLAVRSSNVYRIEALFGLGGGRFQSPSLIAQPTDPNFLGVADVREDGYSDLVLSTWDTDRHLVVHSSDGDGSFTLTENRSLGSQLVTAVLGDFDGDGHVDALLAKLGEDEVDFFSGNGGGAFALVSTPIQTDSPTVKPFADDVDGDGHLDALVMSRGISSAYLGDGAGGFTQAGALPNPILLGIPDVDLDGHTDLVALNHDTETIEVYLGGGDGSFTFHGSESILVASSGVTADFNADGRADVLVSDSSGFQLLTGNPTSGFDSGPLFPDAGFEWGTPLAVDLDGDGNLDAVRNYYSELHLHLGDGDGGFDSNSSREYEAGTSANALASVDIDSDGNLDLLALNSGPPSGSGFVSTLLGDGTGGFSPELRSSAGARAEDLAVADFDEDGLLDAVVAKGGGSTLFVLLGDGAGSFVPFSTSQFASASSYVVTADFDSDGHADVVSSKMDGFRDFPFEVRLLRGDGGGDLAPAETISGLTDILRFETGDFDGDALSDLALICGGPRRLAILRNIGGGAFELASDSAIPYSTTHQLLIADVNEDGLADIVDGPRVTPGGGGPFIDSSAELFYFNQQSCRTALADFDGDGRLDMVFSNDACGAIESLRGDGTGRFSASGAPVAGPPGDIELLAGDFDGNCRPDVVTLSSTRVGLLSNVTPEFLTCRAGNVNSAVGPVTNVLFVNGSRGDGACRLVVVDENELFQIRMKPSPADPDGLSAFVLYAFVGEPTPLTVTALPFGYGTMCMAPELTGGRPKKTWNNTGDPSFGSPDLPSTSAPSLVFRRANGLRRRGTFFLQGLLEDPGSPSGVYGVTNGIVISSR